MAERLQRYLARAGVASRRAAEALITAGRVTVNNQLANTLGTKVEPNDLVALDGKLVMPPEGVSWYVLYKPPSVVTTLDDPQGRPTIRGFLEGISTRLFPIGRLDWDAEGALLLTDDGAAAHRLLHPSFQVPRTYLAKVKGIPTDEGLARLVAGVRLEDGPARALEVERFQATDRNTWLRVTVGEGRPHLVKRLCAAIGHPVVRLFRPHQAGVSVAGMQPGELRPLRPEELAVVEAVAAGQPVPPVTLSLPPRRHGRADEDADAQGEALRSPKPSGAAPRPPKAVGNRPAPATAGRVEGRGAASVGTTRPPSRPFSRGEDKAPSARWPGRGRPEARPRFPRSSSAASPPSGQPRRGGRDTGTAAPGAWRPRPRGGPAGATAAGPDGRPAPPRQRSDFRPRAPGTGWGGGGRRPAQAPAGFQRKRAFPHDQTRQGGGRDFRKKADAWAGARSSPPGRHQGFGRGETSPRGGRPRPPARGSQDFQGKSEGRWAGGRSRPVGATAKFQHGGMARRDAPEGPPSRRRDFRSKPFEGRRRGERAPQGSGRAFSGQRPSRGGWGGAGRGAAGRQPGPPRDGGRPGRGGPRRPVDRRPRGPRR